LLDLSLLRLLVVRPNRPERRLVSRVKDNANLRDRRRTADLARQHYPLEGQSLQAVLDDLQRQEIDIRITLSFERE
jgi:hypothetical protein